MAGNSPRTTPLAPGQVWRHVGYEGVPATGLRVRVLRRHERRGWVCDYPDMPSKAERRYPDGALNRAYELEEAG